MKSRIERGTSILVAAAWVLAPWAGVGLVQWFGGRPLASGLQPAFVPLAGVAAAVGLLLLHDRLQDSGRMFERLRGSWSASALLAWTLATTTLLWTFDHMGLAGEYGWSKSLKQWVMLGYFVLAALAVRNLGAIGTAARWQQWERGASLGLALAVLVALVQAISFEIALPGAEALARFTSSNPSIASGSEELYLGHRFVGIARLRGPMPEPLLFGSYLLAVVPVTAAAAVRARGWARHWRAAVALLGVFCLVATFSRGAWLGAVVTLALVLAGVSRRVLARPSRRQGLVAAVLLALGLGLGIIALTGRPFWEVPGLLLARMGQTGAEHDMSNLTRFWAWGAAWQLFLQAPLTGVGWGGFGLHFYQVAPAGADAAHFGWPVTNNLPLLVLAESGLVGVIVWVMALGPSLRALGPGRPASAASYVLAAACAGVFAHGITFSQWNLPHLWLLVACSAALGNDRKGVA